MGSRSVTTPFLSKTYDIVDDVASDSMISWNENGNGFVVWRPDEFSNYLLPKYFKHNNFSSFIRQLNTYGFRKIVSDRWEFANDHFRKGEKALLSEIQRRKISNAPTSPPATTVKTSVNPLAAMPMSTSSAGNSSEEVGGSSNSSPIAMTNKDLLEENGRLKEQNSNLRSEINRLRSLCTNVVMMMSDYMCDQPDLDNGGTLRKVVDRCDNGQHTEEEMCPRLFGVSLGAKRARMSMKDVTEGQQSDKPVD